MALKKIPRITCGLYAGQNSYIYQFSYNYVPRDGVRISLYFTNSSGIYPNPSTICNTKVPVFIIIGGNVFKMYPVRAHRRISSTVRTIQIDFIDSTFILNNHHVVLTGRGCGTNVHQLGKPINQTITGETSSNSWKTSSEFTNKVKEFTQFPDLEYSFDDFLQELRNVFSVSISGYYDPTITKSFVGTFREVLDAWCTYFNLSYYFEQDILKIINVQTFQLTFPSIPLDAIEYEESEDLSNTFSKTVYSYFAQEGGQKNIAFTDNANVSSIITLYPIGYEYNLDQQQVDLNQVAAAQYGQYYWFLYNYVNGTVSNECGWTSISTTELPPSNLANSIAALIPTNGGIASFDVDKFNQRYQFYRQYGEQLAGRYYLSPQQNDILVLQQYQWFDAGNLVADLNSSNFNNPVSIEYFQEGVTDTDGMIPGTQINKYFLGIRANGNRLIYKDNRVVDLNSAFTLTDAEAQLINTLFQALTQGSFGSEFMDYSELNTNARYVIFQNQNITFGGISNVNSLPAISADQINLFKPIFSSFAIQGVKSVAINNTGTNKDIKFISTDSESFITNVDTVKTNTDSGFTVYYSKFEKCVSESSIVANPAKILGHVAIQRQASIDIPVTFSSSKSSKDGYTIKRDLSYINQYINSGILRNLAIAQQKPSKTLSFSLPYINDSIISSNFITIGLSSMSVEIGSDSMTVTYSFSNELLRVPISQAFIEKLESNMKNSWIRKYNPPETL